MLPYTGRPMIELLVRDLQVRGVFVVCVWGGIAGAPLIELLVHDLQVRV